MENAAFKLQIIEALWSKLRRTRPHTVEYDIILKRIAHLSAEFESLTTSRHLPSNPVISRHHG
jgi:hypothetical protein